MSHMKAKVVDYLINYLKRHYGELVVTRGNRQKCLGYGYKYNGRKKVEIKMKKKLLEAMEAFGEKIDKKLTTSASSHLFIDNEQAHKLDEENIKNVHSVVAKILYIMKGVRLDVEIEPSLLCRRVSKIDVEDRKKLKIVISLVKETIDDKRIIR